MGDDELFPGLDDECPLDWAYVEPAAKLALEIWVGQPELDWAKKAFAYLPGQGSLGTNDTVKKHVAIFRFLVLIGIYHDFCEVAWEQTSYISYAEWCEPLQGLDRFVVGQLSARLPEWQNEEEVEFRDALDLLVEAEREIVVRALVRGFGGVAGLYASLWRSAPLSSVENPDPEEQGYEDDGTFDADEVGKLRAYEWIDAGCLRLGEV